MPAPDSRADFRPEFDLARIRTEVLNRGQTTTQYKAGEEYPSEIDPGCKGVREVNRLRQDLTRFLNAGDQSTGPHSWSLRNRQ